MASVYEIIDRIEEEKQARRFGSHAPSPQTSVSRKRRRKIVNARRNG